LDDIPASEMDIKFRVFLRTTRLLFHSNHKNMTSSQRLCFTYDTKERK